MSMSGPRLLLSAALVVLIAALTFPAHAQQSAPEQPPATMDLTTEHLKAFAQASLEIEALNAEWGPQIVAAEQAGDSANAQAMRNQATAAMVEAIRQEGLDIASYNAIFTAAQQDPAVADQIYDYREELQ